MRRMSGIATGKYILTAYVLTIVAIILSQLGKLILYAAVLATSMVE